MRRVENMGVRFRGWKWDGMGWVRRREKEEEEMKLRRRGM